LTRAPLRFVFDVPPLYDDVDERLRVLERFLAWRAAALRRAAA